MIEYTLNGLLVVCIGLALLRTLDPARARVRLYVCLVAIALAVIPWYWMGSWLPQPWTRSVDNQLFPAPAVEVAMQPMLDASIAATDAPALVYWLAGALTLVGVLAFARIVHQQYMLVRSWRRIGKRSAELSAHADNIPVWLVPRENQAVATLFGAREIFIGELLARHPDVDVALAHEVAHHRLRHPHYEWLMTLLRCVFWWHPVVWFYVARARKEMEIECDEHCVKMLGTSVYRTSLARLLMDVEAAPVGAAFGGRGSFNVERLRRLSRTTAMGWTRRLAALFLFGGGVLGFVFVHADASPSAEQRHKGWNVRYDNVTLTQALEQIAEMGGVDIYLDPRIRDTPFTFEASEVTSWQPLIEGVVSEFDDVVWVLRAGAVFVGSRQSVNDDSWLAEATVLRSHGVGIFAEQIKTPDAEAETLFIDIKFEERFAQDDYNTSEMAVLISLDQAAAIRQGDVHMTFDASGDANLLDVGFFRVLPDSTLSEVGRGSMGIEDGVTQHFTWPRVDDIGYQLWLTVEKRQPQ